MGVTVLRGVGDKYGGFIVDPMLSETALVTRGLHEMNKQAHQKTMVTADISYRSNLSLGEIVAVEDPSNAEAYRAKITGINLILSNGSAQQTLTLERALT